MNKTISSVAFLVHFLNFFLHIQTAPSCFCQMDKNDFGSAKPSGTSSEIVKLSPIDDYMGGEHLGRLVSVNGVIFTQKNFGIKRNSKSLKLAGDLNCPRGFRLLSKADLRVLADSLTGNKFSKYIDHEHLNLPRDTHILSADKVFALDYSDKPSAFSFHGVMVLSGDRDLTLEKFTTFTDDFPKVTKCVLDSYQSSAGRVDEQEDLRQGYAYKVVISMYNAIDYSIELTGGIRVSGQGFFDFTPNLAGCFYIKIKWKMWDGTIVTNCKGYMVQPTFGTDFDTFLDPGKITQTRYDLEPVAREVKLHFRGASAPMAAKPEGGAYILYSLESTGQMHVIEVDNSMNRLATFDLNVRGRPLAIAATESGFVIYVQLASDRHHSELMHFTEAGSLKWSRTIMNNGDRPSQAKEQVTFHDRSGEPAYGMQAMYRPDGGKLSVGRDRIVLIFSHYNNFEAGGEGFRGHTGDSTISFDLNGNDLLLGSSWGTTHSLSQRIVYDGLRFLTASLGDAYPQQIRFTVHNGKYKSTFVDGKTGKQNRYDTFSRSDVVPGSIPGDGDGRSCGRLGGLLAIRRAKFLKYAQVYARRACSTSLQGRLSTNDQDEIGIVFFDRDLNRLDKHKLGDGWNVNSVKAAVYGDNIFVMYSTSADSSRSGSEFLPNTRAEGDSCHIMLIQSNGTLRSKAFKLDECVFGNDEPATLQNGNVGWTFVDRDGRLKAFTLDPPEFLIESEHFYENKSGEIDDDGSSSDSPKSHVLTVPHICFAFVFFLINFQIV